MEGCKLSHRDHEKKLDHTKLLLENVTLLETVAREREAKAEALIDALSQEGMKPKELADRLDVSEASVEALLDKDVPKPVHERIGISEETVEKLDPVDGPPPPTGTDG